MHIPERFNKAAEGVYVQKWISDPQADKILGHYNNDALAILNSDLGHYREFKEFLASRLPRILGYYRSVVAIGGGSPKFEAEILGAKNILVFDGFADTYESFDEDFRKIFEIDPDTHIRYFARDLSEPISPSVPGCVTFVHFLEHCSSWDSVCRWIAAQDEDIVIYGPNIEAANDDSWFHFRPIDHNVFFTIDAISEIGRICGYQVESLAYSDDMLVWMKKK